MVDFTRQRQFKTREAVLTVDKGLQPGVHTFELVVEDDSGNRSRGVQVKVEVVRLTIPVEPIITVTPVRPTIPITPIIPRGGNRGPER